MDFIKNKIIIRSIIASIMPICLYSAAFGLYKIFLSFVAFGLYKIFDETGAWTYNNLYCWIGIGLISVIYPLNFIGLYLLFKPLEACFESKIRKGYRAKGLDQRPNPVLQGNFAPIHSE